LALTVLAAALPLVGGVLLLRRGVETRRFDDQMREFALATMEAGGRERLEREPERFLVDTLSPPPGPPPPHGPRPPRPPPLVLPPEERGTRLWAYRTDLTSANPRAPAVPAEPAALVRGGADHAAAEWQDGARTGRQVLLRTPWPDGPGAVLLVQRPWSRAPLTSDVLFWGLVGVAGGLLLAVLAAAGPLVRRIRRLEVDAREAARSGYTQPLAERGPDELGDLARSFDEAGRDVRAHLELLEARERTLRDFVANTTHDVAIPLTVLQGHLARLRRRHAAGEEIEPDVLHDALDEAHYISCLLQNLSAVARLEAAPEHWERHPVDLVALVERVLARHRPLAEGRRVALVHAVPPEPVFALGDVTLLEQAVSNLVHNGLRHGREDGHVGVVLLVPRDGSARFSLRVFDDGPGVPEDELPRLTQRRFRGAAARQRAPGGAGLGLAIARDVCDRHGFSLALRRADVGGLEAEIAGPREAPAAA
jgi:signal transduction histidine kinase